MEKYQEIIRKMKSNLLQDGFSEDEVNDAFGPAENGELAYLKDLYSTYSQCSRIYGDEELTSLKNISVPESVMGFYQEFEPKSLPFLNGGVTLLGLKAIKEENSILSPGAYLIKYGIITFASTIGGNPICMDLNVISNGEPRIIIADHDFFCYNDDIGDVEIGPLPDGFADEYDPDMPVILNYELAKKCLPEVSKTFSEFLEKIANGEFEDIEDEYL